MTINDNSGGGWAKTMVVIGTRMHNATLKDEPTSVTRNQKCRIGG